MKPTFKTPKGQHHDYQYWDGVSALAEDLATKPGCSGAHGKAQAGSKEERLHSISNSPEESWDLNTGWDKAVEMSGSGWEDGAQRMEQVLATIEDLMPQAEIEGEAAGLEYRFDESGEEVDVGAYLAGDERPWLDPKLDATKPIIRIGVNISASCAVSADTMMARGCMIAAVCRYLERLDYGTQIYVFEHGSGGFGGASDKCHTGCLFLKDSTEYLDPKKLAFWLAHPAVLRRLFFRVIEWSDFNLGSGYGTPADWQSDEFDIQSGSAHLKRATREGWLTDPDKAAAAALEYIKEIIEIRKAKGYSGIEID